METPPRGQPTSTTYSNGRPLAVALAIAAFLSFVYLLTYSGVPHNPDEWFYLAGTRAIITGDLAGVQSHGWLFSLLAAPFYALSLILSRLGTFQIALLLNIPITAATAAILYLFLGELGAGPRSRLVTALAFGLGTLAWPYSHYLFREPAAAMFLLVALWAAVRYWRRPGWLSLLVAGLSFAAAATVKDSTLACLPFFAVLPLAPWVRRWANATAAGQALARSVQAMAQRLEARRAGRRLARLLPWLALALVIVALIAVTVKMAPVFPFIPRYVRKGPKLLAFAALWISPGWGLLAFAPALWIAAIGAGPFMRRYPLVAFAALGGSIFYVLAASANKLWWGYWSFGPRQLVPLIPLLCVAMPAGLRWLNARLGALGRLVGGVLVGASGLIQLVGVLVPFNLYVRQSLLAQNVTGTQVTWDLNLWPIPSMLRFARPEILDLAWIWNRDAGPAQLRWAIVLPLLLLTLLSLAWLVAVARPGRAVRRLPSSLLSALLLLAWLPVAVVAVRGAYGDERYQPDLGYVAAADVIRREARPGDLLVTDLWTDDLTTPAEAMINYCHGQCPPRVDLVRETLLDREEDWQAKHLADLTGYRRAWLVLERVAEGDPNSIVEQWLGQVGYLAGCRWTGPQVRLCLYDLETGTPLQSGPVEAVFDEQIALQRADVERTRPVDDAGTPVRPGEDLHVVLAWQALRAPAADYVVSLQLLEVDGGLAAAVDRRPAGGFRPTNTWTAGENVQDRYSLAVPADAPAGVYQLVVLLYDPTSGQRLPVRLADGIGGDSVPLLKFPVAGDGS